MIAPQAQYGSVISPAIAPQAFQEETPKMAVIESISIAETSSSITPYDGVSKVTQISHDTINIVVHYSVPTGARYLPIAIGDQLIMIAIGDTTTYQYLGRQVIGCSRQKRVFAIIAQ